MGSCLRRNKGGLGDGGALFYPGAGVFEGGGGGDDGFFVVHSTNYVEADRESVGGEAGGDAGGGVADDVYGVGEGVEAEILVGVGGLAGYLLGELAHGYTGHREGGRDEKVVIFEDIGYLGFEPVSPAEGAGVVGDGNFGTHVQIFPCVVGHHVAVGVAQVTVVEEGGGLVDGAKGLIWVVHGEFGIADVGSQNLEDPGGVGGDFEDFVFDGREAVVGAPGNAESFDAADEGVEEVWVFRGGGNWGRGNRGRRGLAGVERSPGRCGSGVLAGRISWVREGPGRRCSRRRGPGWA